MRWLIILLLCSGTAFAQSNLGNWMMYFGTNKIDNHWSIHTEAQHRNYTVQPQLEQLLLRTGVNYKFDNGLMLTGGYANITNYEFESSRIGPEVEEHRIWQQLITASYFGKAKLEHRFRYEQRWIESDFKTRYRYRGMLFYPLNTEAIEVGTYYLGIYDEIFLQPGEATFDRNRLYGGVGYKYASNVQFQLGYLLQTVGSTTKQYLQFGLIFDT
jgi:hypothetical protein